MDKIAKLKRTKPSSTAMFTRTKHKLSALTENESECLDQSELKELRNELIEQQKKIVEILSELSIEFEKINNAAKQEGMLEEIEKINEEFDEVMKSIGKYVELHSS